MTDEATQQPEDDQNLWRATYTTEGGWSEGVAFADHLSFAAPALAQVDGTLYCVHRGARQEGGRTLPVRWTSFTPASVQPFVTALDEAAKPLPQGASAEQTAAWQAKLEAATEALEAARKWTPDADIDDLQSIETPGLVNDNGTLRMVFTHADSYYGDRSADVYETELQMMDGDVFWSMPKQITRSYQASLAPALAVFNGAVHLLYVDLGTNQLRHMVRDAEGRWTPLRNDKGEPLATPWVDVDKMRAEWERSTDGLRANLSLAAHDGKLHLVHNVFGLLSHQVFDGTTWTGMTAETKAKLDAAIEAAMDAATGADLEAEIKASVRAAVEAERAFRKETGVEDVYLPGPAPVEEGGPDAAFSRRTAALASYDGKLHAVFPGYKGDALQHATWTQDGGWTRPVALEGHDSNNTPALLVAKDGPEGHQSEALLLVHRGIDRYVPPPPPAPRTKEQVTARGETVYGPWKSDEGWGGWSRLRHRTSITPGLHDGKPVLILSWEAKAEYYWGFWYYNDHNGYPRPAHVGTVQLRLRDSNGSAPDGRAFDFTPGIPDGSGSLRFDTVIDRPEPGTYTLAHRPAITQKTGGYYWTTGSHAGHNDDNPDRWCQFTVNSTSKATITLT